MTLQLQNLDLIRAKRQYESALSDHELTYSHNEKIFQSQFLMYLAV